MLFPHFVFWKTLNLLNLKDQRLFYDDKIWFYNIYKMQAQSSQPQTETTTKKIFWSLVPVLDLSLLPPLKENWSYFVKYGIEPFQSAIFQQNYLVRKPWLGNKTNLTKKWFYIFRA